MNNVCQHCQSSNLSNTFLKSSKVQGDKFKSYFRYCGNCGYNTYYKFPSYLPEEQFNKYAEELTSKAKGDAVQREKERLEFYNENQTF